MRRLVLSAPVGLAAGLAFAGTPDRDAAWAALIAEAKKHGGVETILGSTGSYVFQRPDGLYVMFTRTLDSRTHAVCVLAMAQNFITCEDWDSGKITYGQRPDANSPWKYSDKPPGEEGAAQKGPVASLLSTLADILGSAKRRVRTHWPIDGGWPPIYRN